MSNKIDLSLLQQNHENKTEIPQCHEKENLFLQDIQLLSSLKSIPGKIIPLNNKINEVSQNIYKENDTYMNKKYEENNKNLNNSKNLITPEKPIINIINNTINNINNIYTTNNCYFKNGLNNTNLNFNFNPILNQSNEMGIIQDQYGFLDSPLLNSPSNPQTFLSMKSDIKNNFLWTNNKFTQNSFYFQNIIINGNYENQKENFFYKDNMNNILNKKISQLSYHQNNFGKEEFLKKKRTSHLLSRKGSGNNFENKIHYLDNNNNNINNNNINDYNKSNKKNSLLIISQNNDDSKKENRNQNIVNIDEENVEKIIALKNKKILFNIENYNEEIYEEEEDDDNIYHNIINNNLDNNNLFNCYQKKRKRRKKNEIKKYKCLHPNCDYSYKTLKQLQNHHYKMASECQLDFVHILKLISSSKKMLIKLFINDKSRKEYFSKLYKNTINNIALSNYFESIVGSHIDNILC